MEVKPLKYKSLPGLSERQLAEHHDVLYTGYVKKTDEIREKTKGVDLETANATYSDLRELKLEETFALNGVKLHEGYFDALGGNGVPNGEILELIKQDFGSFDAWKAEFEALGLCARGWVILAYDWDEGKLRNFVCDVHNQGGVWGCSPILVLDMYEHAYFMDYGAAKKKYIEAFFKNIDWGNANDQIKRHKILGHRKK
ncbi:superoxide dismutase [Candidatus Micrarchaeota archaeon]|nr:superoxide dismutase [Candidatus Micrarchaeota archaeon]